MTRPYNESQQDDPADPPSKSSLFTGIPAVDQILEPVLRDGGVILVGGYTGSGKTALACQIAGNQAAAYRDTTILTTEAEEPEVVARMLSSMVPWPMEKLWSSFSLEEIEPDLYVALDSTGSLALQSGSLVPLRRIRAHIRVLHRNDFCRHPLQVLGEVLSGSVPRCFILDYLMLHVPQRTANTPVRIALVGLAKAVVRQLAEYATAHRIPVVVFCQLKPEAVAKGRKKVVPAQIADFPSVANLADSFIGISQLDTISADAERRGTYSPEQYLTVHCRGGQTRVPVLADLRFQRFTQRSEGIGRDGNEDEGAPVTESEHRGFVVVRRSDLMTIADLYYPPALNVFCYLVLRASFRRGSKYFGKTFVGRATIAGDLGLSENQVREALAKLVDAGLVSEAGKGPGRSKVRKVVAFGEEVADGQGFFMLARSLLNESRAGLLGEPVLFRTWITVIALARHSPSPDGELERGQLEPSSLHKDVMAITHDAESDVDSAVEMLGSDGRISYEVAANGRTPLRVTNYEYYQTGESYRR